jgi:hypothetical protein
MNGVGSFIMVISLIPSILIMKVLLINTKWYVNKSNSTAFFIYTRKPSFSAQFVEVTCGKFWELHCL